MNHNYNHFRGKSGSGTKRKKKSSHRERISKRGTSKNKYQQFSKVTEQRW